jgi:hypothetical protein
VSESGGGNDKAVQQALSAVITALGSVPAEERSRILNSVAAFYGEKVAEPRSSGPVERGDAAGGHSATQPDVSLRDLMEQAQPSTTPQKLATFAHYRKRHEGLSKFRRAELLAYFELAEEPEPANYARDFRAAVDEGWIHEKGNDAYLTKKGSDAVTAGFGGKAKPRGRAAAKKRPKSSA